MADLIGFVDDNLIVLMGASLVAIFIVSRFTQGVANWLLGGLALAGFTVFIGFIAYRLETPDLAIVAAIAIAAAAYDFYLTLTHREPHDGGVDDIIADKDIA